MPRKPQPHSIAGYGTVVGMFALAAHASYLGHPMDPLSLGGGISAVIAATKGAGWIQTKTDAQAQANNGGPPNA